MADFKSTASLHNLLVYILNHDQSFNGYLGIFTIFSSSPKFSYLKFQKVKSYYFFLIGLSLLFSCTSELVEEKEKPSAPPVSEEAPTIEQGTSMLTIDLATLQTEGKLPEAEEITIPSDLVLKTSKTYQAYSFKAILNPFLEKMEIEDSSTTVVTFVCKDGYKPTRYLSELLDYEGYIAFKDMDAKDGKNWIDSLESQLAPYYLVWATEPEDRQALTWPYGLEQIQINKVDTIYDAIYPRDAPAAVAGFEHFKKHCLKCHAINKLGGALGPEMNYPKNILEYWQVEDVWNFAKNPTSYRWNSKMYAIEDLTREEFEEIVKYLTYMKDHKLRE